MEVAIIFLGGLALVYGPGIAEQVQVAWNHNNWLNS